MLNAMCKECCCLNKDCEGTNEQSWTGCIYKMVMRPGQKVKFTSPYFKNRTGTFKEFLWSTGDYLIVMDNKKVLPFKKSELEAVLE